MQSNLNQVWEAGGQPARGLESTPTEQPRVKLSPVRWPYLPGGGAPPRVEYYYT